MYRYAHMQICNTHVHTYIQYTGKQKDVCIVQYNISELYVFHSLVIFIIVELNVCTFNIRYTTHCLRMLFFTISYAFCNF